MTTALEGVRGQRHAPAVLYSEKDPVPFVLEAGWAPGPVWTGAENLAPPGFDPRTVQPIAVAIPTTLLGLQVRYRNVLLKCILRRRLICDFTSCILALRVSSHLNNFEEDDYGFL
jgi:hypothetical protein